MMDRRTGVAGLGVLAVLAALAVPAGAGARESRPLTVFADTAATGASYRIDLTRRTSGRRAGLCLTLRVRSHRKAPLRSRRRCTLGAGSFEYASPSLAVADERDPDNAPLVFGLAAAEVGSVQVGVDGGRPAVAAELRAVPRRFRAAASVFVVRGLDDAPTGVRAFAPDGAALDGVVFPAR